jgi:hypothetical protein
MEIDMKVRSLMFLVVLVLFCGSLSAGDFYAGAKIGPGAVFVYGDDTDDLDPAAGMSLGVFGMFSPMKFFAVQAEFNYEMKGSSLDAGGVEARQYLHYFSIPVIAKAVVPVSILSVQPYAGFNFSFLANANYKGTTTVFGITATQEENNKGDFAIFDMGVLFGAEAFFNVTKNIFVSADLRFELSFLAIDDGRDAEAYNGTFYALFGAGYKF